MRFVADLHIHSKYSRGTSPQLNLENLGKWSDIKGIDVLATGDFTHPLWLKEIKENLTEAEQGFYKFKNNDFKVRFVLSSEISCIYSKNNKVRKIHLVVLSPKIATVEKINDCLEKIGNLHSDGRPILGLDAKELTRMVLEIDENCMVIPAHIWTPWFSLFGSKSGFDSIEECFEEYGKYIFACETGLSSDPAMNWRVSNLDNIALISNSDAHSGQKIGRECNVFDTDFSYNGIVDALKTREVKKFLFTVEFFPEEGKYHFDGHRLCQVCLTPQESEKMENICPKCKKPLTVGVLHRVNDLADLREQDINQASRIPFKKLIPLQEIIADCLGFGVQSKATEKEYDNLIKSFANELEILLNVKEKEIADCSNDTIARAIIRVRENKVCISPGFDGEYGKIEIMEAEEKCKKNSKQKPLFDYD